MATLRIPVANETITDPDAIRERLAAVDITYERWEPAQPLAEGAAHADILAAYSTEIDRLKQTGGYVTADVIDVGPGTAGLDAMLARFSREHWHDEDEVRFVIAGSGLFHIHPAAGPVLAIEVVPGDLLRVPRGTLHWFDLCADRTIRAIRLFQDSAGWTPHYTDSNLDRDHQPICLGRTYVPARDAGG